SCRPCTKNRRASPALLRAAPATRLEVDGRRLRPERERVARKPPMSRSPSLVRAPGNPSPSPLATGWLPMSSMSTTNDLRCKRFAGQFRQAVLKEELEPPHRCGHVDLNHARLPIPPLQPVAAHPGGSAMSLSLLLSLGEHHRRT